MHAGVTLRLSPARAPGDLGLESPGAVSFTARPGEGLARAIWLSGVVPPRPLCLGLGRCGFCRVRYVGEAPAPLPGDEAVLPPGEIAAGWRLACRRTVPDMAPGAVLELELAPEALAPAALEEAPPEVPPEADAPGPAGRAVVLGVDLGTTTLQWRAVAAGTAGEPCSPGHVLAEGGELNPQAGAGADVMSRLAFARTEAGLAALGGLARAAVAGIASRLAGAGLEPRRICLAANTAMTDIFLGRSVEGLCAAPYRREHPGGSVVEVPGLPPMLIPPLPAPFVGGDVSAGLAALLAPPLAQDMPRPFVLADLGTNGEFALLTEDGRLFLASVPLGPALEGIGPERGAMAAPGVVTEFRLGPRGPQPLLFAQGAGAAAPAGAEGISATGYLSLLALLFRLGVLDRDGHFVPPDDLALPLAGALARAVAPAPGGARLPLPLGLWLSAADVELLLKVKAAFAVALEAVCAAAGVAPARLRRLALAGALGGHVRLADLKDLGFAPGVPLCRMAAVGNTALSGACLLAACPERLEALTALCDGATVLELTEGPGFQRAYLKHMRLGE